MTFTPCRAPLRTPCLGTREFPGDVAPWEGPPPAYRLPDDQRERDLGLMLLERSVKRSGIGPPPFFLWDNSRCVLGLGRSAEGGEPEVRVHILGLAPNGPRAVLIGVVVVGLIPAALLKWPSGRSRVRSGDHRLDLWR